MNTLPVLRALEKWHGGFSGEGVRLSVAAGLHEGAAIELREPIYVIGSGSDVDIVLKDSGIEARHALVRRSGRRIEVEALGGDLRVGSREIPKGHGYRGNLPMEFAIGGATVRIDRQDQPASQMAFTRSTTIAAAAFGLFAILIAVGMNAPSLAKPEEGNPATAATEGVQVAALGGGLPGTPQGGKANAAAALEQLAARLEEAGIDGITLSAENQRLVASGAVPKDKSETWTNMQAWFDQTYGDRVVLASDVTVAGVEAPPRLALQAVWFGPRPYILAGDGTRYHEGAYIDNGWAISKIGDKALLLTKDGATIALKYR